MGTERPLGRRPLRPRTRAYYYCVRIQWQNSAVKRAWARVDLLGSPPVAPLFLPVLPASLGGAAPPSRKLISGGSGIRKAVLQYEEMAPERPLGQRPIRLRTRAYDNCVRIQWQVRSYRR
ncbi:hypothetical protein PIB30_106157 [Stylosanthes scabra]|uniref:Uncharacterized protein n=1 Tax=Stylosanthes scabra TaxID=79078 RepID=A0ABU6QZQ0_9FABA|nr:hypothetical protein [Stylosanthes scabra]